VSELISFNRLIQTFVILFLIILKQISVRMSFTCGGIIVSEIISLNQLFDAKCGWILPKSEDFVSYTGSNMPLT
jgi:hypothetical protein